MANKFFEMQKPWELKKKQETSHLNAVLHLTMETLRVSGIVLQPIVPDLCDVLLNKLGVSPSRRMWRDIRPFSWELREVNDTPISSEKVTLYKRILASK